MKKQFRKFLFAIPVLAMFGAVLGCLFGGLFGQADAGAFIGAGLANVPFLVGGIDINGSITTVTEELNAKRSEMRDMLLKAEAEKRSLSADEKVAFDKLKEKRNELEERLENLKTIEKESRGKAKNEHEENRKSDEEKEEQEVRAAYSQYLRKGKESLNAEQRAILEKRALSAVTGSAGAYTIPKGFSGQLEEALLANPGIFQVADIMDTDTGNAIDYPTMNDNGNVGAILGENTDAGASTDPSFGTVSLGAFTYSSKPVLVPNQLLEDSAFDIEAYLVAQLGTRITKAFDVHAITGNGTTQPQGLATASVKGADAAATAVTYDNLIDLFHSVDAAYRLNASFMMSDSTLKALRKLKNSNNDPIFQESLRVGEPSTLLGKPVIINNNVADIATGAKSIYFGDFKKYKVRRVKNYGVKRLTERYAEFNQTAFILFVRLDGKLIDAGTHPVKHLLHA